jgi:hypothetical protein
MKRRAHRLAGLLLLTLCGPLASCKSEPRPAPRPPPPAASAQSLDRLLPGELPEGRDQALGLTLPRGMSVLRSFRDAVVARGRVAPEALTEYVRTRVSASAVQMSADRTTFPQVHVNGAPPSRQVKIDLVRDGEATVLYIDDITPPPLLPGLSDDERWKRAGVNPKDPLDPTQL